MATTVKRAWHRKKRVEQDRSKGHEDRATAKLRQVAGQSQTSVWLDDVQTCDDRVMLDVEGRERFTDPHSGLTD